MYCSGPGFALEEIRSPPGQSAASEEMSPTQAMLRKFKNARHLSSSEKEMYKEIRRQSHISAEQKRRGNIKVFLPTRSLCIVRNTLLWVDWLIWREDRTWKKKKLGLYTI